MLTNKEVGISGSLDSSIAQRWQVLSSTWKAYQTRSVASCFHLLAQWQARVAETLVKEETFRICEGILKEMQ